MRPARALMGDALDNPEPLLHGKPFPCRWPICDVTAENMCLSFAAIRTVIATLNWTSTGLPDNVTFGDLQPRMLCTVCDHRGADVLMEYSGPRSALPFLSLPPCHDDPRLRGHRLHSMSTDEQVGVPLRLTS
jgi:hypothetical protein